MEKAQKKSSENPFGRANRNGGEIGCATSEVSYQKRPEKGQTRIKKDMHQNLGHKEKRSSVSEKS